MEEKIVFEAEDGSKTEFFVLEQTKVNGVDYLLVTDSEEEEAECLILKDLSKPEDTDALYVPVEDENEIDAVMDVFSELLDDVDFESEE